jgi:formyl-CoA transferase
MDEALKGVRILEIGQVVAAPFSCVLLADFGAEVIKIEKPKVGDNLRHMGATKDGASLFFSVEGRNKKSVTLDLATEKGREVFKKLVKVSDVVVENFRPGTLEKLNIGWDVLHEINPKLILLRISGYGQYGPAKDKPAYNRNANAFAGLTYFSGFPDRPPIQPALIIADYLSGVFAALGVMYCLYYRDAKGGNIGQVIDLSLYESVFRIMEDTVADYSVSGKIRERIGIEHPTTVPGSVYKTKDNKWITIAVANDRIFAKFANCIGMPSLIEDSRFATQHLRIENREVIEEVTSNWVAKHTQDECTNILGDEVPVTAIYSIKDIFEDPHYKARESIVEVQDKTLGTIKMQNVVPKLSATPGKVKWIGPLLGEHTEDVLKEMLGLNMGEIELLKEEGII